MTISDVAPGGKAAAQGNGRHDGPILELRNLEKHYGPVLALKPKPAKPVKAAKAVKTAPKKAAKPIKKGEMNTDALEAPHAVKGKPHHFQYK